MRHALLAAAGLAATFAFSAAPAQAGASFDAVKAKGFVQCGVHTGLPGFSAPDAQGNWKGIDVDTCRAVAAAMFGDATKVKFTPLTTQQRLTALQTGEIDVLARNTTWTQTRDTANGLNFTVVNYFDGQGFMVSKKLGVKSAKELNDATVCTLQGTTTEQNLADYFRATKMKFKPVTSDKTDELTAAFLAGRCDAITSDLSQLASIRATQTPNPADYVLLPELISKEPLTPVVRHGDDQWFDLVKWSIYAMIEAEELGITSKNIDEFSKSTDPNVLRLLGLSGDMGKNLGVDNKWSYNIVKQVGNYGESFDRNVGEGSPLKLPRGLNGLWKNGGMMYAIPMR